jgi:hypothetical protein
MLERGLRQAEIARQLRVVPQTVARWAHDYPFVGIVVFWTPRHAVVAEISTETRNGERHD